MKQNTNIETTPKWHNKEKNMIKHTPQNEINGAYFEDLKKHSPSFKKYYRKTKSELALIVAYYKFREVGGRVIAHQTEVLKMSLNKIELAYWVYNLTK